MCSVNGCVCEASTAHMCSPFSILNMHAHNKVTIAYTITSTLLCGEETDLSTAPAGRRIIIVFANYTQNSLFMEPTIYHHGDKCTTPA